MHKKGKPKEPCKILKLMTCYQFQENFQQSGKRRMDSYNSKVAVTSQNYAIKRLLLNVCKTFDTVNRDILSALHSKPYLKI